MKTEEILGIEIMSVNYSEFMDEIQLDIEKNRQKVIVAINPEKIMKAKDDKTLETFINNAEYKIPDGVGILMASKKMGGSIKNRITGVDTMIEICKLASAKKFGIFLLGSKEEVVQKAKQTLKDRFPGIEIVGVRNGYDLVEEDVVREINESGAKILFIAMGSPKQELWIKKNRGKLNVNILQGVGGSFDVIGGFIKRAPVLMQRLGLEWFHRLLIEPSRVFRQMNLIKFYRLINKETKKQ